MKDGENVKQTDITKASITVEAVMVMGMTLMVIFVLLSLSFFVHERAWYTLAACEAVMLGESTGRKDDVQGEQAMVRRLQERSETYPLPGGETEKKTSMLSRSVEIRISGMLLPVMGSKEWTYTATASLQRQHPVKTIRKIRAAQALFGSPDRE